MLRHLLLYTIISLIGKLAAAAACSSPSMILTFQADIDIPLVQDFPPDTTYSPYHKVWGLSFASARRDLRARAFQYFAEAWGVDLRRYSECFSFSTGGDSREDFCVDTDQSDVTVLRKLTRLSPGRVQRRVVAKFFHVLNPEAVGYKVVQSTDASIKENLKDCPISVIDSAYVLDILEDDIFIFTVPSYTSARQSSALDREMRAKDGDRLLYGWYTINGLTSKDKSDVIHYESKLPFNKSAPFAPLAWKLYHNKWGVGESDGMLAQPQVPFTGPTPGAFSSRGNFLPSAFDVKVTSWRNILKFPAQPCEGQATAVLSFKA